MQYPYLSPADRDDASSSEFAHFRCGFAVNMQTFGNFLVRHVFDTVSVSVFKQ